MRQRAFKRECPDSKITAARQTVVARPCIASWSSSRVGTPSATRRLDGDRHLIQYEPEHHQHHGCAEKRRSFAAARRGRPRPVMFSP